jgi:hypothetical protein
MLSAQKDATCRGRADHPPKVEKNSGITDAQVVLGLALPGLAD